MEQLNKISSKTGSDFTFDAIVVGAGHAGIEAALALAKLGHKTLVLAISLESVGFLACNPSIGGTAKGHLVREIDALGGFMGGAADKCTTQLRMLNQSKGFAVQSLRAQVDKYRYHRHAKSTLENTQNLQLRQGEVINLNRAGDGFAVQTRYLTYHSKAVVLCCGVYLRSKILVGDSALDHGPSGFIRAELLSDSLVSLGIRLTRFKTGTPARLKRDTIDLSQLERQAGEIQPYSFSHLTKNPNKKQTKAECFLGYTNEETHKIILENLAKTPRKLGLTQGVGARYCPSVEDKIERFDRPRHQFFLEPEGEDSQEMYIQGVSTSLPASVQLPMYQSIKGLENVQIMRDAYAIEYDCIDPTQLGVSLECKQIKGLFFAGQINGTSGYEEAAAQGLVAGVNASRFLQSRPPFVLTRDQSYVGVMIDDLVTKGTDEPYRMMTSRAEFRLYLRQDNADLRLTKAGREAGLVGEKQYKMYQKKLKEIEQILQLLGQKTDNKTTLEYFIKRHDVTLSDVLSCPLLAGISVDAVREIFVRLRYQGYIEREERTRQEQTRLEKMVLPVDINYQKITGLRSEAAEKLDRLKPYSLGQASRISGVNPADITVLMIKLKPQNSQKS